MRHRRIPKSFSSSLIIANRMVSWRYKNLRFNSVLALLGDDAVLLVDVDDELHLVVGAEENTAAVVDALGDDCEHAGHVAVDCLAAGCGKGKSQPCFYGTVKGKCDLPCSKTMAMGPHSYRIRSLPLGVLLSAG